MKSNEEKRGKLQELLEGRDAMEAFREFYFQVCEALEVKPNWNEGGFQSAHVFRKIASLQAASSAVSLGESFLQAKSTLDESISLFSFDTCDSASEGTSVLVCEQDIPESTRGVSVEPSSNDSEESILSRTIVSRYIKLLQRTFGDGWFVWLAEATMPETNPDMFKSTYGDEEDGSQYLEFEYGSNFWLLRINENGTFTNDGPGIPMLPEVEP